MSIKYNKRDKIVEVNDKLILSGIKTGSHADLKKFKMLAIGDDNKEVYHTADANDLSIKLSTSSPEIAGDIKLDTEYSLEQITNYVKKGINSSYTKAEIDNKLSSLETGSEWKAAVNTFADIATTYPNPVDGWTVNTKDDDITYRYSGTAWIAISANSIPLATDSVDGKLSKANFTKLKNIEVEANKYIHPTNHPASMITEDATHRFMTDVEREKLDNSVNYVHPTTHPASMITEDATHRFATDVEKTTWNGKANGTHKHSTNDLTETATQVVMTKIERDKLNTLENYTHPATHPATMISLDETHRFTTDAEKTAWNSKANGTHKHDWVDINNKPTAYDATYKHQTKTINGTTDLNTLLDAGFYNGSYGSNNNGFPNMSATFYSITVEILGGTDNLVQTARTSCGTIYTRTKIGTQFSSWERILHMNNLFPINSIVLRYDSNNPSLSYGGTWEQIGQGRFIVGVGTGKGDDSDKTFSLGNSAGMYRTTLLPENIPSHKHSILSEQLATVSPTEADTGYISANGTKSGIKINTDVTGSQTSFTNTPPALAVYIWRRTA